MMFKMQMNLTRPRSFIPPEVKVKSQLVISPPAITYKGRHASLLEPMVSRVHKAKPGCSSCGKK